MIKLTPEMVAEIKERSIGSPRAYDIRTLTDEIERLKAELADYRDAAAAEASERRSAHAENERLKIKLARPRSFDEAGANRLADEVAVLIAVPDCQCYSRFREILRALEGDNGTVFDEAKEVPEHPDGPPEDENA